MIRPLSFLLSGYGLIGRKHAELILNRMDCNLTVIVDPNLDSSDVPKTNNNIKLYKDFDIALDNERVDAVILSCPNEFHYNQASSCLARGIPLLVEKPITSNIHDAKKLYEISVATNAKILVGHHRTYSPLLCAANLFLKSEDFGTLVAVNGSALFYKPHAYFEAGKWRTKEGGGPILINLIHEIGILRFFCGEISSVFAFSANKIRSFEVEDTVSIIFKFKNGALGTFILSDTAASNQSWEMNSGENTAYPYYENQNCYFFSGTNGSLDFPTMNKRTYNRAQEKSWWSNFDNGKINVKTADPLLLQLDHFIEVIRENFTPKVSAYDGYKNMQVIEAIRVSIKTNSPQIID